MANLFTRWLEQSIAEASERGDRKRLGVLSEVFTVFNGHPPDVSLLMNTHLGTRYGVGVLRKGKPNEIGFIAGPYPDLKDAMNHNGGLDELVMSDGAKSAIVELPSGKILYKWKRGAWKRITGNVNANPDLPAKD